MEISLSNQNLEYNHGEHEIMSDFIPGNVSRESCTDPPIIQVLNQVD